MKKALAGLCMAVGMAGFSGAVVADESRFYAAIDFGQSKAKDACTGVPAGWSCDNTDIAFRLGAGYQFNQNFGMEANYIDFGKATASSADITASVASDALQLSATGTLPLGDSFAVIGKLGVARTNVNASALGLTVSANSTELMYGIGASYNINKTIAIRAQYEDFGKVGDNATTGKSKLTLLSIGMAFGF